MNLDFSPEDIAFRDSVRAFIASDYPPALRARQRAGEHPGREDYLSWHRALAKAGWVAPGWPVEHGGPGLTPTQKHLLANELAAADTIRLPPFGISMVGPARGRAP